jgi:DNA-binding XRE family transcriptional regulator
MSESKKAVIEELLVARSAIDRALQVAGHRAPKVKALTFQIYIREQRERLRMTLQEVADRAGITKSHMWEMEMGRSANPTVRTMAMLADALQVDRMVLMELALSLTEGRAP